jgi:hypothetical protein
MNEADPRYGELATVGPYAAAIGGALITMVQPHPGSEIAYSRWYEDDHYYAGALAMPWMFAGRRWVAPAQYRSVRYPKDSPIVRPIGTGRYISTYWITEGRLDDHMLWTRETNERLRVDRLGFEGRQHIYTSFQNYLGATYRDTDGPRDIHSLDHPYDGLVVEVFELGEQQWDVLQLDKWLADEYVPALQESGRTVGQTLRFRPRPMPQTFSDVPMFSENEQRITLLHFIEGDPLVEWDSAFAEDSRRAAGPGQGRLLFRGPFVPTLVGTNKYVFDD